MELHETAGLTVAIALVAGVGTQVVARSLRLPALVLMLATGVALGPDGLGVVRPAALAGGLRTFVGLAVALILFEGGLALDLGRIRRAQRAIRGLLLVGATVTGVAAGLLAAWLLGWDYRLAMPFGALVVVTGPTVITPLLARLRPRRRLATILETEGVLGDALGAVAAAVALEVALSPSDVALALAFPAVAARIVAGVVFGLVGGAAITRLRRLVSTVPEQLSNGLTVTVVVLLFFASNLVFEESGIAAVVVAGFVARTMGGRGARALIELHEQIVPIFLGTLFVLLAADVRLDAVAALGWPGFAVCAALVLVVRPVAVALATVRSDLPGRDRVALAAVAPRGIVAASVASLHAYRLAEVGVPGGEAFRAMVFLVIMVTVASAALVAPPLFRALGVRRRRGDGWLLLGATPFSSVVAEALESEGARVVMVDPDPHRVRAAEARGKKVLLGDGLDPSVLARAEVDARAGTVALTDDPLRNHLLGVVARRVAPEGRHFTLVDAAEPNVGAVEAEHAGLIPAFAPAVDRARWADAAQADDIRLVRVRLRRPLRLPLDVSGALLLAARSSQGVLPVAATGRLPAGATAVVAVLAGSPDALGGVLEAFGSVEPLAEAPERRAVASLA